MAPPTSPRLALRSLLLFLPLLLALAAPHADEQQPAAAWRGVEAAAAKTAAARAAAAATAAAKEANEPSSSLLLPVVDLDALFASTVNVNCPPVPQSVAEAFELSPQDTADVCWHPELAKAVFENGGEVTFLEEEKEQKISSRGVPDGVACEEKDWCDSSARCVRVCARGSVQVAQRLSHALETQEHLSARLPLCFATLPGTHNLRSLLQTAMEHSTQPSALFSPGCVGSNPTLLCERMTKFYR